ncbi:MAG: LCP family protein [Actinobacteria bacterium]|nr:LCP family protein [Actinomycetota bacterium]
MRDRDGMACHDAPESDGGSTTGNGYPDIGPPGAQRGIRAAFLSLLLPGAGQLWLGRSQRGVALVLVALSLTGATVVATGRGAGDLAGLLVRPGVIEVLLLTNVLVLAFRAFAIADAYVCGRRRGRGVGPGGAMTASTVRMAGATLALIVLLPHVAVTFYGLEVRATLGGVFPGTPAHAADVVGEEPRRPWDEDGRLTVLLVGSDAGPERSGVRTDTILVASLDVTTGDAALISVPRNLVRVPLPRWVGTDERCRCFPKAINGLYAHFQDRTDLVPRGVDPGAAVLRGALEQLLGVRIDHHAIADLRGFVDAIDALGGVTVDIERRIYDQLDSPDPGEWDAIDLRPGRHHLDGREALVYVRTRRNADDYQRMARQRCFLGTLLEQKGTSDVVQGFSRLAAIVRSSISTDLPRAVLPDVVELATGIDRSDIEVLSVTPPELARRDARGYPVADPVRVRSAVRQLLSIDVVAQVPETATDSAGTATPPPPPEPLSRTCR